MNKYLQDNILLTKEAFAIYTQKLREETAKQHGMTLEQWDAAIISGSVVVAKSPSDIQPK